MIKNTVEASLWTSLNRVPTQYPWLGEDLTCTVAVVGGGLTAAMTAMRFAEAGIDTVMLSADPVGHGATSSAAGIMSVDGEEGLGALVEAIGADRAMIAANLLRESIDNIETLCSTLGDDCGFRRMDCLRYTEKAENAADIRREYSLRVHNGIDAELLDPNEASRQFTFPIEAGVYSKGVAAQADPFRLVHTVTAAAKQHGARIFENTGVHSIEEEADCPAEEKPITLSCSTGYSVSADYVVLAAGMDTGRECGGIEGCRTTYMVATEPITDFSGWRGPCIIRRAEEPRLYLTVTADNRILIGGLDSMLMDEHGRLAGVLDLSAKAHRRYELLSRTLREMFPAIRDITDEFHFAVRDGHTADHLPVIGRRPDSSRIAYALGCGDNGILHAELAGRFLLQQYRGEGSRELGLFSPAREWRE